MARSRVVLNRSRIGELDRAIVTGLELLAMEVLKRADPPDAPPEGEGLVERGGMLSYLDGRRVGGDPEIRRKPKGFLVRGRGASVAVGYGFPARFQELGTARQPPRPFLTPVVLAVVRDEAAVKRALQAAFRDALAGKRRKLLRYRL